MAKPVIRRIAIGKGSIGSKDVMAAYMKVQLDLPDYFGGNLDALYDLLSEVREETIFETDASMLEELTPDSYALKTLEVLSRAAQENPRIHLYLTDRRMNEDEWV